MPSPVLNTPTVSHPWSRFGQQARARFVLTADPTPGLLARVVAPFSRRDLAPDSLEARRSGALMRIEIVLEAMPAEMVHLVAGNLEQIVGVHSVRLQQEITGQVQRQAA